MFGAYSAEHHAHGACKTPAGNLLLSIRQNGTEVTAPSTLDIRPASATKSLLQVAQIAGRDPKNSAVLALISHHATKRFILYHRNGATCSLSD